MLCCFVYVKVEAFFDHLYIHDGSSAEGGELLKEITKEDQMATSSGNVVAVRFTSDMSIRKSGFVAHFEAI